MTWTDPRPAAALCIGGEAAGADALGAQAPPSTEEAIVTYRSAWAAIERGDAKALAAILEDQAIDAERVAASSKLLAGTPIAFGSVRVIDTWSDAEGVRHVVFAYSFERKTKFQVISVRRRTDAGLVMATGRDLTDAAGSIALLERQSGRFEREIARWSGAARLGVLVSNQVRKLEAHLRGCELARQGTALSGHQGPDCVAEITAMLDGLRGRTPGEARTAHVALLQSWIQRSRKSIDAIRSRDAARAK